MHKVREYFPKKGPKRKALMFVSNLLQAPKSERQRIYAKVMRDKIRSGKVKEASEIRTLVATARKRMSLFRTINSAVEEYRRTNPRFQGVILFGGTSKRTTAPTDLDVMVVGDLFPAEKKEFLKTLGSATKMVPDSPTFCITISNSKELFLQYLSKELPYFSSEREWTIQNFFGPANVKRKIVAAFRSAVKELKSQKRLYREKK